MAMSCAASSLGDAAAYKYKKEDDAKLDAFLDALGYRYAEETSHATYKQFMTDEG